MNEIIVPTKPVTSTKEAVHEHNVSKNTTHKKHAYFDAEAEAKVIRIGILPRIDFLVARSKSQDRSYDPTIRISILKTLAEAIHMILSGIGDDIYSTVDACKTAKEMWIAIERLQQGELLNKQDVKINLFREYGKFTSKDGESIDSCYSRFYKMMNEMNQASIPYKINAPSSRHIASSKSHATTRNKGKEIAKPITPPSESASEEEEEEDSNPEQA
nr:hypothetical protein [Tanacetum cinerariifolium]